MTATDELRKLLDDRGVEWEAPKSAMNDMRTIYSVGGWDVQVDETGNDWFDIDMTRYADTPEQAIAATLGAGTCKLHECEGSFSAVNRPVWRCDCGAFMTQHTDATTYHKPRFCPNCGAKVVDE